MTQPLQWAVCCNYAGDKAVSNGAKATLIWFNGGGGGDTNEMRVHSRGVRLIDKWLRADKTWNWRPVFAEGPSRGLGRYATKDEAKKFCDEMNERLEKSFPLEWRQRAWTETIPGGAKSESQYF